MPGLRAVAVFIVSPFVCVVGLSDGQMKDSIVQVCASVQDCKIGKSLVLLSGFPLFFEFFEVFGQNRAGFGQIDRMFLLYGGQYHVNADDCL